MTNKKKQKQKHHTFSSTTGMQHMIPTKLVTIIEEVHPIQKNIYFILRLNK